MTILVCMAVMVLHDNVPMSPKGQSPFVWQRYFSFVRTVVHSMAMLMFVCMTMFMFVWLLIGRTCACSTTTALDFTEKTWCSPGRSTTSGEKRRPFRCSRRGSNGWVCLERYDVPYQPPPPTIVPYQSHRQNMEHLDVATKGQHMSRSCIRASETEWEHTALGERTCCDT